tara:strand:- start:2551 stop:3510 length:960 start_codon:yes stop_codon:yes gene_type:complete
MNLKFRNYIFRFSANYRIGSGHLFHILSLYKILYNEKDSFSFILYDCDKFVEDALKSKNIEFISEDDLSVQLKAHYKDGYQNIIINDVLNTDAETIISQKLLGFKVVNIEDLGSGAKEADILINALYSKIDGIKNQYIGPDYTILREEFQKIRDTFDYEQNNLVLISFGGIDSNQITESVYKEIVKKEIPFKIIQPPFRSIDINRKHLLKPPVQMAETMSKARLLITSMGRTVFEAGSLGIPVLSIAQNKRESNHIKNYLDFINYFGVHSEVNFKEVIDNMVEIYNDNETLNYQRESLLKLVDFNGSKRIKKIIESIEQ